jgi:hypothetical protein
MKYLVFMSLMEPYEKNVKRMLEIENRRTEQGENWGKEMIFPIYNITTTGKSFMIVETDDPLKLAKYRHDYGGVLEIEAHMIQDFSKLRNIMK